MDKILSEQRKDLGGFEVIDFEDEAVVQGVRSRAEIDELRRLYDKGKVGQWNAQTDLDWDTSVDRNDWMMNPDFSLMANCVKMSGGSEAAQKEATHDEIA